MAAAAGSAAAAGARRQVGAGVSGDDDLSDDLAASLGYGGDEDNAEAPRRLHDGAQYDPMPNTGSNAGSRRSNTGEAALPSKAMERLLSRQRTTDLCCCWIFCLFWAKLASVTWFSLQHGDPRRLFHGYDFRGSLCGVSPEVADDHFVYWPRPEEQDYPICVGACPTDSSLQVPFPVERVRRYPVSNKTIVTEITMTEEMVPSYPSEVVAGVYCLPVLDAANASSLPASSVTSDGATFANQSGTALPHAAVATLEAAAAAQPVVGGPTGPLPPVLPQGVTAQANNSKEHKKSSFKSQHPVALNEAKKKSKGINGTTKRTDKEASEDDADDDKASSAAKREKAGSIANASEKKKRSEEDDEETLRRRRLNSSSTSAPSLLLPMPSPAPAAVAPSPAAQLPPAPAAPKPDTTVLSAERRRAELQQQLVRLQQRAGTPVERLRNMFKDIADAFLIFALVLLFAIAVAYAYFYLLKSAARVLTWAVLAGMVTASSCVSAYCLLFADKGESQMYLGELADKPESVLKIIGVASAILTVVLLVFVCYIRVSVKQAVGCIESSCEALWSLPRILGLPLLEIGIKVIFALVWSVLFSWVLSTGEISATAARIHGAEVRGLVRRFSYTMDQRSNIAWYIVGFWWGLETITVTFQFIVAYAVATWYFTPCAPSNPNLKPVLPARVWRSGLWCAARYHIGSIALGAAVLGVFRLPHLVLQYVASQAKGENAVARTVAQSCVCAVWCFEEIVRYVDKNAIIEMILRSRDFFASARAAVRRVAAAPEETASLCGITSAFQALGSVGITAAGAFLGFWFATHLPMYTHSGSPLYLETPAVVAVASGVLSFIIASAFMSLVDMTSDTLFFCWLEDGEDESAADEDYTPQALKKLLGAPRRSPLSANASETNRWLGY
eukprot:TRINITY_DN17328_c0_g1_i1.p1 TRINITY_DN17328_c0_g1~~TRINITY_DN17328_c0_g1_i1.p1  ORF type:complete len:916 (+),score=168.30 TRINITY_DN17328_c0_g1_i1:48-2750(+)